MHNKTIKILGINKMIFIKIKKEMKDIKEK
jgi:hypothetical protein